MKNIYTLGFYFFKKDVLDLILCKFICPKPNVSNKKRRCYCIRRGHWVIDILSLTRGGVKCGDVGGNPKYYLEGGQAHMGGLKFFRGGTNPQGHHGVATVF